MYIYVYISCLFPLQDGHTPLRYAAMGGHTTCLERLLSTPGIDVNIKNGVSSCFLNKDLMIHVHVVCNHKAALNTQAT